MLLSDFYQSGYISKVFEKCVLSRYDSPPMFFASSDIQFGFRRGLGCLHAIYTAKSVVNEFTRNGSVNLCALSPIHSDTTQLNWT